MQSMMVASQQQLLRKQSNFNLSTSPNSSMTEGKPNTVPNTPTTIDEKSLERNNSTEYVVIDSDPRVPDDSTSTQVNSQEKKPKRDSSDVFTPDSPPTSKVTRPKKTRRSNPSSSWLGLINPSYKTRAEEFGKLFDNSIPSTERLVVDYSCALQKEILVHGRVYVTLNYICFYANIFKWETRVVIKCKDISCLTKTNTAKVIPNAIQINTNQGDKYILTSFAARDKSYVMMFRVWQNALLDQPMSPTELWAWVRSSYGDDLGFSSDEEEEAKEDFAANIERQRRLGMSDSISSEEEAVDVLATNSKVEFNQVNQKHPKRHINVANDSIQETEAGNDGDDEVGEEQDECLPFMDPVSCGCQQHKGRILADVTFPIPVDTTFKLIFSESKWYKNMMSDRKAIHLQFNPWEETSEEDSKKKRIIKYTVTLNHALLKSAPTIETQYVQETRKGEVHRVKTYAVNRDIPYCDTFYVSTQYCLTRGRQENESRILIHADVIFNSTNWSFRLMKPIIEKNAYQGITDFSTDIITALNKYCNDGPKEIVNEITEFAAAVELEDTISPTGNKSDSLNSRTSLRRRLGTGLTMEDMTEDRNLWTPIDVANSLKRSRSESLKKEIPYASQDNFFTLRIILGILLVLFVSNLWLYFQLWKLESAADSYENLIRSSLESGAGRLTQSPSQESIEALKKVLLRTLEMVQVLAKNLSELNHDLERMI